MRALICVLSRDIMIKTACGKSAVKGVAMEMIQTYQGYFKEDGQFVPDSLLIKIPVRRRAIVNIFEDEVAGNNEAVYKKTLTVKKIIADALESENDDLTDADWDELANLRVQTNSGLSRAVDL